MLVFREIRYKPAFLQLLQSISDKEAIKICNNNQFKKHRLLSPSNVLYSKPLIISIDAKPIFNLKGKTHQIHQKRIINNKSSTNLRQRFQKEVQFKSVTLNNFFASPIDFIQGSQLFQNCKNNVKLNYQNFQTDLSTKSKIVIIDEEFILLLEQRDTHNFRNQLLDQSILVIIAKTKDCKQVLKMFEKIRINVHSIFTVQQQKDRVCQINNFFLDITPVIELYNDTSRLVNYFQATNMQEQFYFKRSQQNWIPFDFFSRRIPIIFARNVEITIYCYNWSNSSLVHFLDPKIANIEIKQMNDIIGMAVQEQVKCNELRLLIKNLCIKESSITHEELMMQYPEKKKQVKDKIERLSIDKISNLNFIIGDLFSRNYSLLLKQNNQRFLSNYRVMSQDQKEKEIENLSTLLGNIIKCNKSSMLKII